MLGVTSHPVGHGGGVHDKHRAMGDGVTSHPVGLVGLRLGYKDSPSWWLGPCSPKPCHWHTLEQRSCYLCARAIVMVASQGHLYMHGSRCQGLGWVLKCASTVCPSYRNIHARGVCCTGHYREASPRYLTHDHMTIYGYTPWSYDHIWAEYMTGHYREASPRYLTRKGEG